jgi:hypothetical protein
MFSPSSASPPDLLRQGHDINIRTALDNRKLAKPIRVRLRAAPRGRQFVQASLWIYHRKATPILASGFGLVPLNREAAQGHSLRSPFLELRYLGFAVHKGPLPPNAGSFPLRLQHLER